MYKPFILIIRDGWGEQERVEGNAVVKAKTPVNDELLKNYPYSKIIASGESVGLPEGQMGNSEVGHLNIGAGRIVYQELTRINLSMKDGSFRKNEKVNDLFNHVKQNSSTLHLLGLCSDGGVHSHLNHLFGILEYAKDFGLDKVYIHAFMDGRDTSPTGGAAYLQQVQDKITELGIGQIVTIIGRYYAMDRDNRWERIKQAYDAMVYGQSDNYSTKHPSATLKDWYAKEKTDEFIPPTVMGGKAPGQPFMNDGDGVFFFNFRGDRARQITRALVLEDFDGFEREKKLDLHYLCMTQYDKTFPLPVAYPPVIMKNILGDVLQQHEIHQLRTAETEKYAHVTFFFNGGVEQPYENEERKLIPSPKVATYDLKPEMSAYELTDEVISRINQQKYGVIILNYANPDMVGHTGDFDAAVKACETVDECVGKVVEAIQKHNGAAIITADHGNAEKMLDENNNVHTAHTTNLVNLIYVGEDAKDYTLRDGILADISPTILDVLGIDKPEEMTGSTLRVKK